MTDLIQGFRQALQDILTLEIREIKGEIKATNARLDAQSETLNGKLDAHSQTLNAKLDAHSQTLNAQLDAQSQSLNARIDALTDRFDSLRSEFVSFSTEVGRGFELLHADLENARLRSDLEDAREMAEMPERLTRVEVQVQVHRSLPQ